VGWRRGESGLDEIAEMNGYSSPRLGVRFEPGEGSDNLKIIGLDGAPFLSYVESSRAEKPSGSGLTPNAYVLKPKPYGPKPNRSGPMPSACVESVWRPNSASWASTLSNSRPAN
jgi:hypothetical protein